MRNILKYPVTHDELLTFLKHEMEKFEKQQRINASVGDMSGIYIEKLISLVEEAKRSTLHKVDI